MNNVTDLLVKLTKELKEPITKKELAEMYNEEYGTNYGPQVFGNSEKLAAKIIATDRSRQRKAHMFYIAKVPLVDQKFKAKLEEIGEFEIDEKYCLTKLTLGDTVIFQLPEQNKYERSVHKFCSKFFMAADTPVSRNTLFSEHLTQGGTGSLPTFKKTFNQVFNNYMDSDKALEKKAKFCFTMGAPVTDGILKKLRKIATVRVNEANQITSFKSHDRKLKFSGKPRKIQSKKGSENEQGVSMDVEMPSEVVKDPAPESKKPSESEKIPESKNLVSEASTSLQISATRTPKPSEDFRIPKIPNRVPVDPRAIAEAPRKRPMERVLTTDPAVKRMKNAEAMKEYYERHRKLALQGKKEQKDTVAPNMAPAKKVKKVRFTETFEVREFRKEDWIVPPSQAASTPEAPSSSKVVQGDSSRAHLNLAPEMASPPRPSPLPAMKAPTLPEPTFWQTVFENKDLFNVPADVVTLGTTHEALATTTHGAPVETTHEVELGAIYETELGTTHEDAPKTTHEAPVETTHEDFSKTTHEALAPPPQSQNLRKPVPIKPEPVDDYDDEILIWRETPKRAKVFVKQEPKDPEEEEELQYDPIPYNLNIVREEDPEDFEAPKETPKGPMVHKMLEVFAEILEAQLLEIHPERFGDLIQKWKGLKDVLEKSKMEMSSRDLLFSFESIIGKRLSPILVFEEGTPAQKFLEDIQLKIKHHQVINVENREEKLMWKEVKRVFKKKLDTVDRYEVFTYNTIITCFSKLVNFFELL